MEPGGAEPASGRETKPKEGGPYQQEEGGRGCGLEPSLSPPYFLTPVDTHTRPHLPSPSPSHTMCSSSLMNNLHTFVGAHFQ